MDKKHPTSDSKLSLSAHGYQDFWALNRTRNYSCSFVFFSISFSLFWFWGENPFSTCMATWPSTALQLVVSVFLWWLLLLLVVILISNGFLFPFVIVAIWNWLWLHKKVVAFHVLVSCDPFFELPREIYQLPLAHLCIIVFCVPVLIPAAWPLNNNMSCTSWLSILFDVISP